MGSQSGSPVDGGSWQVDVLSDRVSGNTQLLGDAPQGDTLQPGVVDSFPQGLLARRCLLGWRSVRGGAVLIIHRLFDGCFQSGQALQLQLGETMPAQGLRFLTTRASSGVGASAPWAARSAPALGGVSWWAITFPSCCTMSCPSLCSSTSTLTPA